MERLPVGIVLVLLLAPLAAAQGTDPAVDGPSLPAGPDVGARIADAARAAGDGLASGAATAASAAGALGHGLASAAQALANSLASLASSALAGFSSAALAAGRFVSSLAAYVAASVSAIAAWIGVGARAGYDFVRAHPVESASAAGGALGLGALLYALRKLGFLLGLPLYTRLAPSQMLDNKARAAVYEHVRAHPGAHPSAIAEALDLGWGTVVYHLSKLESSSLITCKPAHHRKCYFAVGTDMNAEARTAVAAMAHDKARLIVQAVRDSPGISQKDLAQRVGMSQALASWHVKKLVESGVLVTARSGRSNALSVAAHVPVMAAA